MYFKNPFSSPWSPASKQCLCFQGRSPAGWFLRCCQPQPQWGNQSVQVKRGVQLCGRSLPYTGLLQRLQIAVAQRLPYHRWHQALTLLIQVTGLQHSKIKINRTWAVATGVFEVGVGYLSYICIFFPLGSNENVVMSSIVHPWVYIVVCSKVWELHWNVHHWDWPRRLVSEDCIQSFNPRNEA